MLKTLIAWKLKSLLNRFKHGKSARMILITVALLGLWLIAVALSIGLGKAVSDIRTVDSYKLWNAVFGFTSFLALFLPLRQMRSGKTGLGQFNFLPITKIQAYLSDWIDRLLMLQTLLVFIVLSTFGMVIFPVTHWIIFLPMLLGWIIVLQILTRLVFSLFQWLKSKNKYSQQLVTVVIVLLYLGATNMKDYPLIQSYFGKFNEYWISSIFAKAIIGSDLLWMGLAIITLLLGLIIDKKLYHFLEERDNEPMEVSSPAIGLLQGLKLWTSRIENIWLTILSRHPMFKTLFLIMPVIVILTTINKLTRPILAPADLDRFTISTMMIVSIVFSAYGLGIVRFFANAHLSDKNRILELMNGYKQIMVIFVVMTTLLETAIPVIYFYDNPFIYGLIWNLLGSIGISFICIDIMIIAGSYFTVNVPAKMAFKTGNRPDQTGVTIISIIVMIGSVLLKTGLSWMIENLTNGHIIVSGISVLFVGLSMTIMPKLYTNLMYSRREIIVEKIKEV